MKPERGSKGETRTGSEVNAVCEKPEQVVGG